MQLGARATAPPPADDLAAALRGAADQLGHRPAITVRRPERRDEQGFASLVQWAAKTAHWLEIEHMLEPGDVVDLVSPPGWPAAAACLGAWWAGVTVHVGDGGAEVAIVHEATDRSALTADEVFVLGDAVDGSPEAATDEEPFVIAVQAFPDQPPVPRATADAVALVVDDQRFTHTDLLTLVRTWAGSGTAGVEADADPTVWLPALAVRPLVTGSPTVLVDGVDRDSAAGERVAVWLDG